MACFIVPLTQAIATTIARRRNHKKTSCSAAEQSLWMTHLPQLELMLWGGSSMLIVDHIINGEVTWQYPFFTALAQKGGFSTMIMEMLTVGVPMSLVTTLIYTVLVMKHKRATR